MRYKLCACICAVLMALAAAGCSSADSSSEQGTVSAVSNDVLTSTAEVENVKIDTSVDASDLETGFDTQYATSIAFSDDSVSVEGEGVTAEGTTVKITAPGTYILKGSCKNGRIVVDAGKKTEVRLVLGGLDLTCADFAPIYAASGSKLTITLSEGSVNTLTDGAEYTSTTDEESKVDAAIFSKADLTVNGEGSLTVKANCKHGIVSKDSLVIAGGKITVDAASTAMTGKDSVKIIGGELDLTAGTNGIKSTNSEDAALGFVSITDGKIKIVSGGDGIQAETNLLVDGGEFDITTGGGSANAAKKQGDMFPGGDFGGRGQGGDNSSDGQMPQMPDGEMPQMPDGEKSQMPDGEMPQMPDGDKPQMPDGQDFDPGSFGKPGRNGGFGRRDDNRQNDSAAGNSVIKDSNTASTESSDTSSKALKAGSSVVINGGSFNIDSSDDSIHSNGSVSIAGGKITAASGDDGVHADKELTVSGSAELEITKSYEGLESKVVTISGGTVRITASDDGINASAGSTDENGQRAGFGGVSEGVYLKITGGTLYVNASGDGLDSNGDFYMEGGSVAVSGPTNGGNGALDFGERCKGTVTGGTLIACGAVGMEEGFSADGSTQYSFLHNLASTVSGGTEVKITDRTGKELLSWTPEKSFQSIVFTSSELKEGETYTVTAGSLSETVTLTSISTSNSTGMGGFGGFGGGRTR